MLPVSRSIMLPVASMMRVVCCVSAVTFLTICIGRSMDLSSFTEQRMIEVGGNSHMKVAQSAGEQRKTSIIRRGDEVAIQRASAILESAAPTHNTTCAYCATDWISTAADPTATDKFCPIMIKRGGQCGAATQDVGAGLLNVTACAEMALNAGASFFSFGRGGTNFEGQCKWVKTTATDNCVSDACCPEGFTVADSYDFYKIAPKATAQQMSINDLLMDQKEPLQPGGTLFEMCDETPHYGASHQPRKLTEATNLIWTMNSRRLRRPSSDRTKISFWTPDLGYDVTAPSERQLV